MSVEKIERKIAVIFATDVVGYSKHMETDEVETVQNIRACEKILTSLFDNYDARLFNTGGDSFLAEFPSAVSAVECAVAFQEAIYARNGLKETTVKLEFRIGLNSGDVIKEKDNLLGDGVNIAARLEALAQTNGITVSKGIYDFVKGKTNFEFNDIGIQKVKQNEFHAYDLLSENVKIRAKNGKNIGLKLTRVGVPALVLVLAAIVYLTINPWTDLNSTNDEPRLTDQPSIFVSKLKNFSGNSEYDYLSFGITNAIITALSSYSQLDVQSMNTTEFVEQNKTANSALVSKYGSTYKLSGNYQLSASKVRINLELISLVDDELLLSDSYDFSDDNFFAIQDEISKIILNRLGVELTLGSQATTWMSYLNTLEQYKLFMDWRSAYQRRTEKDYYASIDKFDKLMSLLPEEHPFRPGLQGFLNILEVNLGIADDPKLALEEAKELSKECMIYAPKLADCYSLYAYAEGMMLGNWSEALNSAIKITEIDPTSFDAMAVAAVVFGNNGDWDKAASTFKRILNYTPHAPTFVRARYMRSLLEINDFAQAKNVAIELSQAEHIRPQIKPLSLAVLAYLASEEGDSISAKSYFSKAIENDPPLEENFIVGFWGNTQRTEFLEDFLFRLKDLGL
ncbi:hypothetical protein N9M73_04005 [Rhodobacteraceae bacterium]|nr:hypothetical protein [Paracoccaceae bacterium]